MALKQEELKEILDGLEERYNRLGFIEHDPICIPHEFSDKKDIEISAFFAAIFAWGQRKTIINKCRYLFERMDDSPHDFIVNHQESDLLPFQDFVHRTFNFTDLKYFFQVFKSHYLVNNSMESLFLKEMKPNDVHMEKGLRAFKELFFALPHEKRTEKHVSSPASNSACKRINMFLRWMVRKDNKGVDFGIWDGIKASQLLCPLDVHVIRIARQFELLKTDKANWNTCLELTSQLRAFCPEDPVKYDFALFGFGVENKEWKTEKNN